MIKMFLKLSKRCTTFSEQMLYSSKKCPCIFQSEKSFFLRIKMVDVKSSRANGDHNKGWNEEWEIREGSQIEERGAIFEAEKDGISRIRTDRCELRMKLEEIRSLLEISSNR